MYENDNPDAEYIKCDICREEDTEDEDMIVLCSKCSVGVHQSCYGRELKDSVPEDDWICQRCTFCF